MVKNTHEVLVLAKILGRQVKEILADGKVNVLDIPKLAPLWEPTKQALEGFQEIPKELTPANMTAADVQVLIADVVELAQIWMDAISKSA